MKFVVKVTASFMIVWSIFLSVFIFNPPINNLINWNAVSALASFSSTLAVIIALAQLYETRERSEREDKRIIIESLVRYTLDSNRNNEDFSIVVQNFSTTIKSLKGAVDLNSLDTFVNYPVLTFFFNTVSTLTHGVRPKDFYINNNRYFDNPIVYPGDDAENVSEYVLNLDITHLDSNDRAIGKVKDLKHLSSLIEKNSKIHVEKYQFYSATNYVYVRDLLSCTVFENEAYSKHLGFDDRSLIKKSKGYQLLIDFCELNEMYESYKGEVKKRMIK